MSIKYSNTDNWSAVPAGDELTQLRSYLETRNVSPGRAEASVHPVEKHSVSFDGKGNQVTQNLAPQSVSVQQLRPGHVIIPGVGETTVEAARAAGLLPPGFNQAGFDPSSKAAPATAQQTQQQNNTSAKSDEIVMPEAVKAADNALANIGEIIGQDAVNNAVWLAAETGEAPTELPSDIPLEVVDHIVAGAVAQADAVLKATGANVALLDEMLSASEARQARTATVTRDDQALQKLGREALGRLEVMPSRSPAEFAEWISTLPKDERKALSQDQNGNWAITVPGRPTMSWGAAVRAGIVRVEKGR
ncbi:hypothetical protein G6N74_04260 [Mesorhizobium sp. CGMCC 1.15528]|uniref:Uncharacterized protein n=1 Tax=Mesorhizobium zhangyense TaxID=1776730 RepID=A0A7C9V9M3_9HYPH|nr:hypothetical protein [Mesorhizobium zhangyense]NGN40267.1 hypothetical protein [Mesorhizobium zhangyense]